LIFRIISSGAPLISGASSKGAIQGVRYDELAPMLLNEVQQQKSQLREMQRQVAELKKLNDSLQVAMAKFLEMGEGLAMR
jgi:TolA-binding protein